MRRDRGCAMGCEGPSKISVECFKYHKHNHYAKECKLRNCYNCEKIGHITRDGVIIVRKKKVRKTFLQRK